MNKGLVSYVELPYFGLSCNFVGLYSQHPLNVRSNFKLKSACILKEGLHSGVVL